MRVSLLNMYFVENGRSVILTQTKQYMSKCKRDGWRIYYSEMHFGDKTIFAKTNKKHHYSKIRSNELRAYYSTLTVIPG